MCEVTFRESHVAARNPSGLSGALLQDERLKVPAEWADGGGVRAGARLHRGTWLNRYETDSPLWVLLIASARIMEMSMTWRKRQSTCEPS